MRDIQLPLSCTSSLYLFELIRILKNQVTFLDNLIEHERTFATICEDRKGLMISWV